MKIYNADALKDTFQGNDYIGIVPSYVPPLECGGYFETYNPKEFAYLKINRMFEYIKGEPLEKICLKVKSKN